MARISIEDALRDADILDILGPVRKKAQAGPADPWETLASDCLSFFCEHGALPSPAGSISEKRLARRLEGALRDPQGRAALERIEDDGFRSALASAEQGDEEEGAPVSIDAFLASDDAREILGGGIFDLEHVSPSTPRPTEDPGYVGRRVRCNDFARFEPIFDAVRSDVRSGNQELTVLPKADRRGHVGAGSAIREGNVFSLDGLLVYVASVEDAPSGDREEARLRLIFDNGTQSDVLLGSFAKALRQDRRARWLRPAPPGPLFGTAVREDYAHMQSDPADYAPVSGHIYLLKSLSDDPAIAPHRSTLYKIGCTRGEVDRRIVGAETQPTYLCAPVEVVAEFRLHGLDPFKVEKLLHRFFSDAQLDITLRDRWGNPYQPREWFILSPSVVKEAIEAISAGTLPSLRYDGRRCRIVPR